MKIILLVFIFTIPLVEASLISERDVLESALKHYPAIVQAMEGIEVNRNDVRAAKGAFDARFVSNQLVVPKGWYIRRNLDYMVEKPLRFANSKIYAGYTYGANGVYPTDLSLTSTNNGGTPRIGGSLSLIRNFSTDRSRTTLKQTRLSFEQSKNDFHFTELQVKKNAMIQYWAWIASIRNFKVFNDLLRMAEDRDEVLGRRVKAGDISQVIVTENRQYVARRRAELAGAELFLKQSTYDLSLYLRDPNGEVASLNVPDAGREDVEEVSTTYISELLNRVDSEITAPALHSEVFAKRPDVLSLGREIQKLDVEINYNENNFLPQIDLDWNYHRNIGRDMPTNFAHVWTFLVRMEIPLEFNLLRGEVRASRARKNIANSQFNFLKDTVKNEIYKNYEGIRISRKKMDNASEEMKYARELLRAENLKFDKGGSNFFLINLREENLAQAQSNFISSQLDFIQAYAEYKASTASL